MPFDAQTIAKLKQPLDKANVKPPAPGKYGDYIEGWKVIEIANDIFGHDGWDCTITRLELTNSGMVETQKGPQFRCGYLCTVQVTAGGITRSGTGHGTGAGKPESEGDHHDSAAKEAETDAMKRALRTFGYPLGLALYDKTKANVGTPSDPVEDAKNAMRYLTARVDETKDVAGGNMEAFATAHSDAWALVRSEQQDWLKDRMAKRIGTLAQAPPKNDLVDDEIPF